MLGWAFLGSVVLVLGIGLTGEAAFIVAVMATFCSMFQHSNLTTPHWLGFIVTRPESHSVHHERGIHGFNYGDIPLFDMFFGTFRNPREWNGEAGFLRRLVRRNHQTSDLSQDRLSTRQSPGLGNTRTCKEIHHV